MAGEMKYHVIVVSDMHLNSAVSLCPPIVNLDDGGTYHASKGQRWLWDCWKDFVQNCAKLEGEKIAILNGDLAELDIKRRSIQLVSTNKATIQRLILEALEPLIDVVDHVIVIRGTAAHTGKSAWIEEAIANDLDHTARYSDNIASWWHFRGVIGGVRMDVAHHASMGSIPWGRANAVNTAAAKITWLYTVKMKQPIPHVAIRSHNHLRADSYDNYDVRVLFTPCWSLATEYSYRTGRENDAADIGGYVIHCENGKYDVDKYNYNYDMRQIWKWRI